ncbi:MAG TPA: HAD-IA family hydrolase [Thermoplasmata archaeon]|nr:HAD-IA family hydrolase [Thermoplasmata archaeon]
MTEGFDAVLFDAGGVLWDLKPSPEDLFADALRKHGVAFDRVRLREAMNRADRLLDDEFATLDGSDESGFWRSYDGIVLEELGAGFDVSIFAGELRSEFREAVTKVENWVPFPDATPALEAVRRKGLRTGMVSNATELARRVLRNLDMEKHFDFIVISDEVGVRKPHPKIFGIALELAGTVPSRTVFLGDKPATDIVGATRAGLRGVLVDRRDTFPDSRFDRIRNLDAIRHIL